MDIHDAVDLALDGLDEGYRVIGADLNALLKTKYRSLKIGCEAKHPEDSIERAREKLKRALPRLPLSLAIPSDVSQFSLWTLGDINGNGKPWGVPLGNSQPNDYLDALDFLIKQVWTKPQWQVFIVEPVTQLQAECTNRLNECLVQETDSPDVIPPEFRTKPITKTKAAKLLGQNGTKNRNVEWVTNCIEDKILKWEKKSRQSGVYDIREFPEISHRLLRPN